METFSALLAICAVNSLVPGEFPAQRLVTRSFDVFFDLHRNKLLSKHWWGWWFEPPSCPLWRHRNVHAISLWHPHQMNNYCTCEKGALWPSLSLCTMINPILLTLHLWNHWSNSKSTQPLIDCCVMKNLCNECLSLSCYWNTYTIKINPCHAKSISGNMEIHLHFLSFPQKFYCVL